MICIYEKTESDFTYNGLGVLEPMECTFKPIINNVWSLEMTLPYDAEGKSQLISNDRILKVTDIDCISEQTSDEQLFRIYDFKKEDNFVSVIAYPIGLDARFDTFVDSVKMNYKTASQAIAQMNGLSSKYTVSGSGYSSAVKSAEYANANLISILNGDNGFVQVWDGEICYDNYNIRVNHRLGSSSNPLDVRYGKNITGMSYDMDASNIITQLYPKSKDNYPLNINNRNYVNASNFADYPIPHMYYIQAPFNLVQLSDDGSEEYLMSADVFDHIKTLTAEWLNKALSQDEIYGGLLKEIELDWINNNYDLTMIHDGVQGIVEYLWRKLIGSSHANITHGAVQSLIYNAMKAGFDDVLKNSDSGYYIGSTSKKLMDTGFGTQFYSYEWDVAGQYRVTPDGEGYVWVYASSKWNQLDTNGETTGATDKTKWKRYKVKGKTYKRYGNKKKNRYLKSQWWKINDVWYWFDSNGKSIKGSALNSMYYEYFEDAEIMLDGEQQTIYDILTEVCSNGESQLVGLLNNQMEQYCLNLFENEKLSYPTVKLDINMVDLSQTTEYKDFQSLERIHLGDSVKVFNPRLGIESTVRVIGLTYDVLRKMNTEIQIGVTETSVINLLNNIGKGSNEVRYVAGDGITIENNTISVIPPTKPYLEDVILNGESVVRNHKAYIDLDELGIDESIDVLYGEEEPDAETDGEDKDFYFELSEGSGHVINENDYEAYTDATHPISITSFTRVSDTEYNFNITGTPSNDGNGENIFINLTGLIEGEQYTITFDAQYSSGTTFPYSSTYDSYAYIRNGIGETLASEILQSDTQKHFHTITFTASAVNKLQFFLSSKDNVSTTLSITDLIIDGDIQFVGEIEEFYNKHQSKWLKYNRVKEVKIDGTSVVTDDIANINTMTGATSSTDGAKGLVPQPTIADKEKYLRGDGTWQDAQGASAVSDLTDVNLNNLADGEILKYDATLQKWINSVGGGGGAGGSSVYSEKVLWEDANGYTSNTNASVTLTDSLLNYDAIVIEVSRESDYNFRNQEFVLVSMIDKTGIKWFPFDMIGSSTDCVATCRYIDETHLILGHWTYIKPVKYYKIVGLKFGMPNFMHGTSAPTANEGTEGCLFLQTDNKFIAFDGEANINKWAEPLELSVDMSSVLTISIEFKINSEQKKNITVSINDFPSSGYLQIDTHGWAFLGYHPSTAPNTLYVYMETGQDLYVYHVETIMNNNEARIHKIFGKINNKWLEYQPN